MDEVVEIAVGRFVNPNPKYDWCDGETLEEIQNNFGKAPLFY